MEAHIRSHVDRDMAFELLRKLQGFRGKSCKLDVLHQKVIDAWTARLTEIHDEEFSEMMEDHAPGVELDRRYIEAHERAAHEEVVRGMSAEDRLLWGV